MTMQFKVESGTHVHLTRDEEGNVKRTTYKKGDVVTANEDLEKKFTNSRRKRFTRIQVEEVDEKLTKRKKPTSVPPAEESLVSTQEESVVAVMEEPQAETEAYTREELQQMKVVDLEEICAEFGVDTDGVRKSTRFKKADLISAILGE